MESGRWKREKKIERGRLTKKNAEHHADEMTHSDKRTKRGFRHSPEVTQGEPRSSLPARMNKRRSGFCWPGVYRGLSSLTQMSRVLRRCRSSRWERSRCKTAQRIVCDDMRSKRNESGCSWSSWTMMKYSPQWSENMEHSWTLQLLRCGRGVSLTTQRRMTLQLQLLHNMTGCHWNWPECSIFNPPDLLHI